MEIPKICVNTIVENASLRTEGRNKLHVSTKVHGLHQISAIKSLPNTFKTTFSFTNHS